MNLNPCRTIGNLFYICPVRLPYWGGRRQEARGKRREQGTGNREQGKEGKRQEARGEDKARGKRQEARGKRERRNRGNPALILAGRRGWAFVNE
jgi:hypothetical protein